MKIEKDTIERLLYSGEGDDLDFKSGQYKFIKASNDEKSYLLKDILSFANSWRRSDAYILIGVKENNAMRAEVCGIGETIDDAKLQQFVNSKTNSPIEFSYQEVEFDGKRIAVIFIPVQSRPFYLEKDFGRLKSNEVYVRRGSSNAIASPDEISKMGSANFYHINKSPILEVYFADIEKRVVLEKKIFTSLVLCTPDQKSLPDYKLPSQVLGKNGYLPFEYTNTDYYRELARFTKQNRLYCPVCFAVKNVGSQVARDVRLEISIEDRDSCLTFLSDKDLLKAPNHTKGFNNIVYKDRELMKPIELQSVTRVGTEWVVEIRIDKVQPKNTSWVDVGLFVGILKTLEFTLDVTMFSDDLSEPCVAQLFASGEAEHRDVNLEEIENLEDERFENSPGHQKFLKEFQERGI